MFRTIVIILSALSLASCGGGGGSSEPVPQPVPQPTPAPMDFTYDAPQSLTDFEYFEVSVSPENLQSEETITEITIQDPDSQILFLEISGSSISGNAPFTYTSVDLTFDIMLTSSTNRTATKSITIPVNYSHKAEQFNNLDNLLAFNPDEDISNKLQNDNYAVWDIMPMFRGERKLLPGGTYCYPTPDKCSTGPGTWPPGFISGGGQGGDFDGDGDEDVIVIAGIGDRRFLALGSDEDKSYWSTIHLLWNDGTGRLSEDFSKYDGNEPPRHPSPDQVLIEDFNSDGIDDLFVASFGIPVIREDNTNYWEAYPHLILLSGNGIHKNIPILQNEPEHQETGATQNTFSHDASMGDVDGDGDIDVFMNAVLYFNDGNGDFDIVDLNVKEVFYPCCGITGEKIDKMHAHASAMGDYDGDGFDDLAIFWAGKPEQYRDPDNPYGPRTHNNVLLGPVYQDEPIFLDNDRWKTLPDNYYGPEIGLYNDAESADLNGDGLDDILVASTRGVPYYAGRHVQILISNGDGTFKDETEIRFANQPRANLELNHNSTGIGQGKVKVFDMDQDGDLDIVDTTANYGGEDTRIYPKVTLALNNGEGVFEEVPLDYFPKRMDWSYFDNVANQGMGNATELIQKSGVVDLDGQGHLDFVSSLQGNMDTTTEDDPEPKNTSVLTTQSFISKKRKSE